MVPCPDSTSQLGAVSGALGLHDSAHYTATPYPPHVHGSKLNMGKEDIYESPQADLSSDIWLKVFSLLDCTSLTIACNVCKQWKQLGSFPGLWERLWKDSFAEPAPHRLSSNDMGGCAAVPHLKAAVQAELAKRLLSGQGGDAALDNTSCLWRTLLQRKHAVDQRWLTGDSSVRVLRGHGDFIRCIHLEGSTLVTASGSTSHTDCTVRLWDVHTGECQQLLRGHMGPIWCMAYDHASKRVVTGADDYTVRYWDASSGNSCCLQDPDSAVRSLHLDPVGRQLVAGTEFGRLMLWDLDRLEELLSEGVERVQRRFDRMHSRRQQQQGPGGSPGGSPRVASPLVGSPTAGSGHLSSDALWRVVVDGTNSTQAVEVAEENRAVSSIQVECGLCASTSLEPLSRISLWDVSRGSWQAVATLGGPDMMHVNCMSFERGLSRLVAGCGDRAMRVWDLERRSLLHVLRGHTDEVHSHQFDASTVASAALNGSIRLWDLRDGSGRCARVLEHGAPMHAFQYRGDRLVSGTWDGRVLLWDLGTGKCVQAWETHNERVWAVTLDDFHIVSAGLDKMVCVRSMVPEDVAFAGWGDRGRTESMPVIED